MSAGSYSWTFRNQAADGDGRKEIKYGSFKAATVDDNSTNIRNREEFKKFWQEREEACRQRERSQLDFVQKEHSAMLTKLHLEIEKLQLELDSVRYLCSSKDLQIHDLELRLKHLECECESHLKELETVKKQSVERKSQATNIKTKAVYEAATKPSIGFRKTVSKTLAKDSKAVFGRQSSAPKVGPMPIFGAVPSRATAFVRSSFTAFKTPPKKPFDLTKAKQKNLF